MAVGLPDTPTLEPVEGLRLAAVRAGIRRPDRADLLLIEVARGGSAAAVFTRNAFRAAPVVVAERHLAAAAPRYLLVNAGNANAGTGERGVEDALACCRAVAERGGCAAQEVLPFSTGVIGERLPVGKVTAALDAAFIALDAGGWAQAARAIMTTDTVPKGASRRLRLADGEVTITGIAKGAGMIRPDMATMLAFVATDAVLDPGAAREALGRAVARSFNRITVDGDTSTNDACVLLATGDSGVPAAPGGAVADDFAAALESLCRELAQAIVRDGEGATKFITVAVEQAASEAEALAVARCVAESPLVKTAAFASDPNWGRILAAVGRAPVPGLDIGRVELWLGDVRVAAEGALDPGYTEAAGAAAVRPPELTYRIVLGRGRARAELWTCDLSYDYVRINAEYRS